MQAQSEKLLEDLRTAVIQQPGDAPRLFTQLRQQNAVEPYEIGAFVRGQTGIPVHEAWDDDGKSYWVCFYDLRSETNNGGIVTTLEADGAVDSVIGIFRTHEEAIEAVRRVGSYEKL